MEKILVNRTWELLVPPHRAKQWQVTWEPDRLKSMHENIIAGDIIVDIGSENGDMTALYSMWAGLSGDVIMVEAVANYWPWAKQIFEANGLRPPLKSFCGFASNRKSEGDRRDMGNFGTEVSEGWPPATETGIWIQEPGFQGIVENTAIPQLMLSEIVRDTNIDILTFDVEGAEFEVVMGAEYVIKRDRPIIYASVHPEFMQRDYGHHQDEFYLLLEGWGYRHRLLASVHEEHVIFFHPEGRQPK